MATHGENIGSRKVEPKMNELPKWRLKANYLMRQLARIWYGKLSLRDYPNSSEFERLFLEIMCQFVEDHEGYGAEVLKRIEQQKRTFEEVHDVVIRFSNRVSELDWMIRTGIPKSLYEVFAKDELILNMLTTVEWLIEFEEDEKQPPYSPEPRIKPLDYYEQLPVLEPDPEWRRIATHIEHELACVWYGKYKKPKSDLEDRFWELLFAFADNNGIERKEFRQTLSDARGDFEYYHGFEIVFRTPAQEIVWAAQTCLPEHLSSKFLSDPQISHILSAWELMLALIKADHKPPYEKYAISFRPIDEYECMFKLTNM